MKQRAILVMMSFLLVVGASNIFANGRQGAATSSGSGNNLSYWVSLNPNVSATFANLGETPFAKELAAKTNTVVKYLHPVQGAESEQFNLIIASGEYPDIMEYNWLNYPGGPEKAIADGVIMKLNDIIDRYCPNLKAYLRSHPDIDKQIKTDNGSYYTFPFIRGDTYLLNSFGAVIRKDWLDELGLKVPATIDEWYMVLTEFKQKKGVASPLSLEGAYLLSGESVFAYAYNLTPSFYVGDDKKVHYGMIEPSFKDYLITISQWYKEGLFDPDIVSLTGAQVTAKVTSGASGASIGWLASGMGNWITSGKATNPSFALTGAPYPVLRGGAQRTIGRTDLPYANNGVAITTACKNIEAAARLLDYGYGEAGNLLFNFGVQGESYTMVNGYPTYSTAIMNPPREKSKGQMMATYARSAYFGPMIQDRRYLEQYLTYPEQVEAANLWMPNAVILAHKLPPLTPTPEESGEFARIMNEINTYTNEMVWKFILGSESFNNYDAFVNTVKQMRINRAVEIYNNALTRFNAR
ncbi:MAG: extracellular solute-binding protein [Treponema sp.]|jgi:putative aldouronate transport system substrate-binding protein|nr:extracellular solute-binding protein [Treponema sp.]